MIPLIGQACAIGDNRKFVLGAARARPGRGAGVGPEEGITPPNRTWPPAVRAALAHQERSAGDLQFDHPWAWKQLTVPTLVGRTPRGDDQHRRRRRRAGPRPATRRARRDRRTSPPTRRRPRGVHPRRRSRGGLRPAPEQASTTRKPSRARAGRRQATADQEHVRRGVPPQPRRPKLAELYDLLLRDAEIRRYATAADVEAMLRGPGAPARPTGMEHRASG